MHACCWTRRGLSLMLLGLAATIGLSGCGGSSGSIAGKVYYKGQLVKGGNVQFVASDGSARSSPIGEDGTYTIDKMRLGDAKISVDTSSFKPQKGVFAYGSKPMKPPPGQPEGSGYKPPDTQELAKRYVEIPEKYSDPNKSGLTYTVKSGRQDYDIKME
jgi:hypothetical protein